MVKVNRTKTAPASLAIEKEKGTENYRERDVVFQLNKDFNGKCYLCEIDKLQSIHIEHLKPHHGKDRDLMFDWNNLFLSCPHCNSVKNQQKYEDAIRTAGLLTECFEKENTGIRILECQTRVNALQTTMTTLYRCLANYKQNPSQRNYRTLRGMLNRSHKFAGFTRTYVRNHIDEYPDLSELVAIA